MISSADIFLLNLPPSYSCSITAGTASRLETAFSTACIGWLLKQAHAKPINARQSTASRTKATSGGIAVWALV